MSFFTESIEAPTISPYRVFYGDKLGKNKEWITIQNYIRWDKLDITNVPKTFWLNCCDEKDSRYLVTAFRTDQCFFVGVEGKGCYFFPDNFKGLGRPNLEDLLGFKEGEPVGIFLDWINVQICHPNLLRSIQVIEHGQYVETKCYPDEKKMKDYEEYKTNLPEDFYSSSA